MMRRLKCILQIMVLLSLVFIWGKVSPAIGYPISQELPWENKAQIYLSGEAENPLQAGGVNAGAGKSGPEVRQRMIILFEATEGDKLQRYPGSMGLSEETLEYDILRASRSKIVIVAEFNGVLNGLVAMLTGNEIGELLQVPGVKDIVPDQLLQVALDGSLAPLHVPEVWSLAAPDGSPVIGSGIRVAVIDTGIDYRHTALGSCFGEGCRVMGGWDFVNNDPDPMDDHGHGTHVAGIIASNDHTYRGVAPDAFLLAYKACGKNGECYSSHVIAAINQAVEDGAQIINLSLAGEGQPDSPLSVAVNKAADMGVIVVAPAGNNGSGKEYNIGTPGNAEKAITVGATYKSGQMANFSARGGIWDDYYKPDLVAPGVGIRSTYPGGQFVAKDGTSMAAPHVAGAAALILQLHPTWTPLQIKASLMQTAKLARPDDFDAMIEGGGIVQLQRAVSAKISIEPTYLVGRLSATPSSSQTLTKSLILRNNTNGTRTYQLTYTAPPGIKVKFNPSRLTLNEGSSCTVLMEFIVENDSLPEDINISGNVHIQNSADPQDEYHIPYGLTRYVSAAFEFDEAPFVVIVQERAPGSSLGNYFASGNNLFIDLLLPGLYDFIFIYPSQSHFVIRSGVRLDSIQTFAISKSEAKNRVRLGYRDRGILHALIPEHIHMLSEALIFQGEPLYASSRDKSSSQGEYYFSDFPSEDYHFNLSVLTTLDQDNEYYDFSYSLQDIKQDLELAKDIENFNRLEALFSPRGDREPYAVEYSMTLNGASRLTFRQSLSELSPASNMVLHFDQQMNDINLFGPTFSLRRISLCKTSTCYDESFHTNRFYETPFLRSEEGYIAILTVEPWDGGYPGDFVKINEIHDEPHRINYYSSFWNGKFANLAYRANLYYAVSGYDWETPYLRDWAGNMLVTPIEYRVFSDGAFWASGDLSEEVSSGATKLIGWGINLPSSGATRIEMSYVDTHNDSQIQNEVIAEFDTSKPDPNPPTFQALLFCQSENATNEREPLVYLYIEDETRIGKVEFSLLRGGSWQSIPVSRANTNIYKVETGYVYLSGSIPVRFMATDISGNRITQQTSLPSDQPRSCPELLLGQALNPSHLYLPLTYTP